jgi:hypothetical protein
MNRNEQIFRYEGSPLPFTGNARGFIIKRVVENKEQVTRINVYF